MVGSTVALNEPSKLATRQTNDPIEPLLRSAGGLASFKLFESLLQPGLTDRWSVLEFIDRWITEDTKKFGGMSDDLRLKCADGGAQGSQVRPNV
jgi:hypothetical protein